MSQMKPYCFKCGAELDPEAIHCPECGRLQRSMVVRTGGPEGGAGSGPPPPRQARQQPPAFSPPWADQGGGQDRPRRDAGAEHGQPDQHDRHADSAYEHGQAGQDWYGTEPPAAAGASPAADEPGSQPADQVYAERHYPDPEYGPAGEQYGQAELPYADPEQHHAEPASPYAEPGHPYTEPGQQHAAPGQPYAEPEQPYAEPEQPYAEPERPYAEPERPYADPERPYAGQGQPYGEPEQPYPQQGSHVPGPGEQAGGADRWYVDRAEEYGRGQPAYGAGQGGYPTGRAQRYSYDQPSAPPHGADEDRPRRQGLSPLRIVALAAAALLGLFLIGFAIGHVIGGDSPSTTALRPQQSEVPATAAPTTAASATPSSRSTTGTGGGTASFTKVSSTISGQCSTRLGCPVVTTLKNNGGRGGGTLTVTLTDDGGSAIATFNGPIPETDAGATVQVNGYATGDQLPTYLKSGGIVHVKSVEIQNG